MLSASFLFVAEVKLSRTYMKGIEFKSRQQWLDFECAASIALRVMADSIESLRKWFKKWKGTKPKKVSVNRTKWLWVELTNIQGELKWQI